MITRYSVAMRQNQTLPKLWLISDARNDQVLERSLRRMPRGSGFIYRHYHLNDQARWDRFQTLCKLARACDHQIILADTPKIARIWGADGSYGLPRAPSPKRRDCIHLAAVHTMRELALANQSKADAALISPVFTTRSHPGGNLLGRVRFLLLTNHAQMPVIALGGMNRTNARSLGWKRWAAIDGLSG